MLFNLYREWLVQEALEGMGDRTTETVKYADDLVLVVKEDETLQDILDRLVETRRNYGLTINFDKLYTIGITRKE